MRGVRPIPPIPGSGDRRPRRGRAEPARRGRRPSAADRLLIFAINTHSRWSNPSQNEFDIAIDVTGSPAPDFFVVGVDLGAVLAGAFDGRTARSCSTRTGDLVDAFFAEAPMNGSTALLPVAASSLGLSADAHDRLQLLHDGLLGPRTGVRRRRRQSAVPAVGADVEPGRLHPARPGRSAPLTLTLSPSAKSDGTLGWMVVALDDANGAPQAELVPLPTKP